MLLADSLKNDSVNFAKNKTMDTQFGQSNLVAVIFREEDRYTTRNIGNPIIYGGFAGCAYALSWNNKMYKDYSQAYMDLMDDKWKYKQLFGFIASQC